MNLSVGRDRSSLSARAPPLLQALRIPIRVVEKWNCAVAGINLQIAAIEQQHLIRRPRSTQLCELCRTRGFGKVIRMSEVPRHEPSELPSSDLRFLRTASLFLTFVPINTPPRPDFGQKRSSHPTARCQTRSNRTVRRCRPGRPGRGARHGALIVLFEGRRRASRVPATMLRLEETEAPAHGGFSSVHVVGTTQQTLWTDQ
jgi:hypothetical protein